MTGRHRRSPATGAPGSPITALVLAALGRTAEVGEASRTTLKDLRTSPTAQEAAAEAWLRAEPDRAAEQIAELAIARPAGADSATERLVLLLDRFGETEAALRIAGAVLRACNAPGYHLRSTARVWVSGGGDPAVLLEALARCTAAAGYDSDDRSALLRAPAELGATGPALSWARAALGRERGPELWASSAITVWPAAAGPGAATEIMELLEQGARINPFDLDSSAEALLQGGAPDTARQLAERALGTPHASSSYYQNATAVLFEVSAPDTIALLSREPSVGDMSGPEWISGILATVRRQDGDQHHALQRRLAKHQFTLPTSRSSHLETAVEALASITERAEPGAVVTMVIEDPRLSVRLMLVRARSLASIGERQAAFGTWREVLAKYVAPLDGEWALLQDIQAAGAEAEARTWLAEPIGDPTVPSAKRLRLRLRLRQMLAWLSVTP